LIEEPENSIHPKALVDLFSFIKSFSESKQFIITSHSITLINKARIDEIIVSTIKENGLCEFYNVNDQKDLRNRLKKSRTSFSDELFFAMDDTKEFE
jgi:predicted ATP-dependent endonuclease of OLD family